MSSLRSSRYAGAWTAFVFIAPILVGFMMFTFVPVLGSFMLSFCSWDLFAKPRFVGMENFRELLSDGDFWRCLLNTTVLMASVPITLFGSLALAILMNQKLRGVRFFRLIFHLPSLSAGVAVYVLWSWLYNNEFGLVNTLLRDGFHVFGLSVTPPNWLGSTFWSKPALIMMNVWLTVGGRDMILYLAALANINPELYEAAAIDGAGWWGKFWHITWPMVSPTTFFILIMSVIAGFQGGFEAAYVMTDGGPAGSTTTLSFFIYNHAYRWLNMGYASAAAWLLFLVVLAATLLQWRLGEKRVHYA